MAIRGAAFYQTSFEALRDEGNDHSIRKQIIELMHDLKAERESALEAAESGTTPVTQVMAEYDTAENEIGLWLSKHHIDPEDV